MSLHETVREVERRKTVIEISFKNYDNHLKFKEYYKASEDLWGIANSVLYSLGLLKGEKLSDHSKILRFVNDLAVSRADKRIGEGFDVAQSLHANYYHNFMDENRFNRSREKVELFIAKLERILMEELRKLGIML